MVLKWTGTAFLFFIYPTTTIQPAYQAHLLAEIVHLAAFPLIPLIQHP